MSQGTPGGTYLTNLTSRGDPAAAEDAEHGRYYEALKDHDLAIQSVKEALNILHTNLRPLLHDGSPTVSPSDPEKSGPSDASALTNRMTGMTTEVRAIAEGIYALNSRLDLTS